MEQRVIAQLMSARGRSAPFSKAFPDHGRGQLQVETGPQAMPVKRGQGDIELGIEGVVVRQADCSPGAVGPGKSSWRSLACARTERCSQ